MQQYRAGAPLSAAETHTLRGTAAVYRQRLGNLSWFMKCLNEPIARQANREDGCTGHFWEARFHSQALRSEAALLTAMAYVDLNPIRAGIAKTPEQSEYTGIRARVTENDEEPVVRGAVSRLLKLRDIEHFNVPARPLMPFSDETENPRQPALPMKQKEYLSLVDQTGRIAVHGKRGTIDASLSPILTRLGLSDDDWFRCSTNFRRNSRNGELRPARSA